MKGAGFGFWINLLVGIVGGFIGGNVLGWIGIHWGGTIGQIATAVIGAVLLLWVLPPFGVIIGCGSAVKTSFHCSHSCTTIFPDKEEIKYTKKIPQRGLYLDSVIIIFAEFKKSSTFAIG